MAREFPLVWDRIVERWAHFFDFPRRMPCLTTHDMRYMRYEDKIGNQFMADQAFAGRPSRLKEAS